MASIRKTFVIAVPIDEVWDAVRDFGNLHERLVPGFATNTRLEGRDRFVTLFDGGVVRERMISRSDDDRRLVWSIVDGPWTHHNGSVELVAEDERHTRFVWTTDLLPDEIAETTEQMMERAVAIIVRTLEHAAAATT